ncbi:Putative uncharacterized protein [Lactococcus lactis subsp. lactis A12]|jgi:peptidoglycan/LPS O-acetylase OafA/YrhL
MTII